MAKLVLRNNDEAAYLRAGTVPVSGGGPGGTEEYVPVTIQSSEINATLTDYPLYIDLSDMPAAFWAGVQSNGGDIRATSDSGGLTQLPVELVWFDDSGEAGELYVGVPSVSSSVDTTVYIWYKGSGMTQPAASDTYGREAIWDNAGYAAVYHLEETSGTRVDSGGGNLDVTPRGGVGSAAGGQVGSNVADFDNSSGVQYFDRAAGTLGALDISGGTDITVSFLSKLASSGTHNMVLIGSGSGTSNRQWQTQINTTVTSSYLNISNGATNTLKYMNDAGIGTGDWEHHFLASDTSVAGVSGLNSKIDGANPSVGETASGTATSIQDLSSNFYIGYYINTFSSLDGQMDEVRVAASQKSNAWGKAEGLNYMDTANFYTVGGAAQAGDLVFADAAYLREGGGAGGGAAAVVLVPRKQFLHIGQRARLVGRIAVLRNLGRLYAILTEGDGSDNIHHVADRFETSWKRGRNLANTFTITTPRNGSDAAALANIGRRVKLYRGETLVETGLITDYEYGQSDFSATCYTEEIRLARHMMPSQFGYALSSENPDVADYARQFVEGWYSIRVKDVADWQNYAYSGDVGSNLDAETLPGYLLLGNNSGGSTLASAAPGPPFRTVASMALVFEQADFPNFTGWDRIRWVASNGPFDTDTRVRLGYIPYPYATQFEILTYALADTVGFRIPDPSTPSFIVRVTLETSNSDLTPTFGMLEVIARRDIGLEVGNITSAANIVTPDISVDGGTMLDALAQVARRTGHEFRVRFDGTIPRLDFDQTLGQDKSDQIVLVAP